MQKLISASFLTHSLTCDISSKELDTFLSLSRRRMTLFPRINFVPSSSESCWSLCFRCCGGEGGWWLGSSGHNSSSLGEGERKGGREGKEGGREERNKGGREERREGGKKGGREEGREGRREGGKKGGKGMEVNMAEDDKLPINPPPPFLPPSSPLLPCLTYPHCSTILSSPSSFCPSSSGRRKQVGGSYFSGSVRP